MDPHQGLSLWGDEINALPHLEPGTWNIQRIGALVIMRYINLRFTYLHVFTY